MESSPLRSSTRTKPLRVLVADDVVEIQQLVTLWLGELGCEVTSVANGRQALEVLRRREIDLLITDILMPEMDGLEVLNEVRRAHPRVRLLAMSGGGVHLHASDCLKLAKSLGAHGVLLKPFKREQLLAVIDAILAAST